MAFDVLSWLLLKGAAAGVSGPWVVRGRLLGVALVIHSVHFYGVVTQENSNTVKQSVWITQIFDHLSLLLWVFCEHSKATN